MVLEHGHNLLLGQVNSTLINPLLYRIVNKNILSLNAKYRCLLGKVGPIILISMGHTEAVLGYVELLR